LIREFLVHRQTIIFKRTTFDLKKAEAREHILQGFVIVLQNIDEAIALIKASSDTESAIAALHKRFMLTEEQGKAVLEMRLQRLTGLEQDKLHQELVELRTTIQSLKQILSDREKLKQEIVKELLEIKEEYADARRTKIESAVDILSEQ